MVSKICTCICQTLNDEIAWSNLIENTSADLNLILLKSAITPRSRCINRYGMICICNFRDISTGRKGYLFECWILVFTILLDVICKSSQVQRPRPNFEKSVCVRYHVGVFIDKPKSLPASLKYRCTFSSFCIFLCGMKRWKSLWRFISDTRDLSVETILASFHSLGHLSVVSLILSNLRLPFILQYLLNKKKINIL